MDAFEIRVTPQRVRNAKEQRTVHEPIRVLLAPFCANSVVVFQDIPVKKEARRFVIFENPTDSELNIRVENKAPKPVRNVNLDWKEATIAAGGQVTLEISWLPIEVVACKERFVVVNPSGYPREFSVIFKSVAPSKPGKKPLRPQNYNRCLKLKTPSPPKRLRRASPPDYMVYKNQSMKRGNKENSPKFIMQPKKTPPQQSFLNGSDIFDRIQFTPAAQREKTDLDYMASLPTPNGDKFPEITTNFALSGRKINWSPNIEKIVEETVCRTEKRVSYNAELPDTTDNIRRSLFEEEQILHTSTETYIKEQKNIMASNNLEEIFQATFQVPKNVRQESIMNVEKIVTTPLQKKISESLQCLSSKKSREQEILRLNQGSMPNLHEIEKINSIEANRYFGQKSIPEQIQDCSILFRENEIRAQSSCSNLHEIAKTRQLETNFKVPHVFVTEVSQSKSSFFFSPPPKPVSKKSTQVASVKNSEKLKRRSSSLNEVLNLVNRSSRVEYNQGPRKVFYDAEMHLQAVLNRDPFAATTTADPFLSATLYLDEQATDKYEKQFKNWLNALVTVPAEMESAQSQIDIGKIFADVRNKKETLPQTKESISCKYFNKYRLPQLRKAAVKLYTDPKVALPLSKLDVLIQKKQISIRDDRILHKDLVLQKNILELLLSFNSLWLRIGLEVIFGEEIRLNSNSDIYGLTTFILNRLFRDKYIETKVGKGFAFSEKYNEQIKKHSLKYLLHLVIFLDQAKQDKIIKNNPCLFTRASKVKETREILIQITSNLVANIGDITKYLKRLGIVLAHKQTILDEFDFSFNKLAVDLRDGVRLVKVMEVILLRDDLLKGVRVPAISRLQKIHNVDLALKALSEADYVINGDIIAKDIVDGHKEKTLSLLWQIIYKFRAPKFNAAAKIIQRWWKNVQFKICIDQRIDAKRLMRKHQAATVIQKCFRGYRTRAFIPIYIEQRTVASVVIQTYFRRFIERKRFLKLRSASLIIQKWWMKHKQYRKERKYFLNLRVSTIRMQQRFRGNMEMKKTRDEFVQMKNASILIQERFRNYLEMKHCRVEFLRLRKSAIVFQSRFRAQKAMEKQREEYNLLRNSTLKIQRKFRATQLMKLSRVDFIKKQYSAILIQQFYRGFKLMRKEQAYYQELKSAATTIQAQFRAIHEMKKCRKDFLDLKAAVKVVEEKYMAKKNGKIHRMRYLRTRWATITIQRQFRAQIEMRKEKENYLQIRSKIISIQRYYRGYRNMLNEKNNLQQLKWAATVFQTRFRALKEMRMVQSEYKTKLMAIRLIQSWVRNCRVRDECRKDYLKKLQLIKSIQVKWKATLLMRQQKQEFNTLKLTTIKIQQKRRATLKMRNTRDAYQKLRWASTCIQNQFRANLLARKTRHEYEKTRVILIQLQRRWRATLEMKLQRNSYDTLKSHAIIIQRRWRAKLEMRKEVRNYENMKIATVKIQTYWGSILHMRHTKASFDLLKSNCIIIQKYVRRNIVRKTFLKQKYAATTIQTYFRSYLQMKEERRNYLLMKQAAITVQTYWRSRQEMVIQRNKYHEQRNMIIRLQQRFRGKRLAMTERTKFLEMKTSAITIQRHFRALILGREQRYLYKRQCEMMLKLQSYCRGYLARKAYKKLWFETMSPEAIELRLKTKAALKIQAVYRGFITRKKYQTKEAKLIVNRLSALKKNKGDKFTVGMYLKTSLIGLQKGGALQESINILKKLDFLSRHAPHVLVDHCELIAEYCYRMMAQSIRSEPHKYLIELCCKVNLNLARYKETKPMIFMPEHLTTVAQMMLRWSDKDCGIFNTLCTLIWILIQCPDHKPIIYEYMTAHDGVFVLKETKRAVMRKEKMLLNRTKFGIFRQDSNPQDLDRLPNPNADFGFSRPNAPPYTFRSRVTAFNTLVQELDIDLYV